MFLARRFLRLELSTQLFVLLGLMAVMAALVFALARLAFAQSWALERARIAAGVVAAMVVEDRVRAVAFTFDEQRDSLAGLEVRLLSDVQARTAGSRFDLLALQALQAPATTEYHEIAEDRVRYAARLPRSGCIAECGSPHRVTGEAPPLDWAETAPVALVSVSAPVLGVGGAVLPAAAVEYGLWGCALSSLGVLVLFGCWLRHVLRSARVLEGFADRVVNAAPGQPVARVSLDEDEHDSANELHRLSLRLRALYRALHRLQIERVPQK
jgi:hypothetical protein